MASPPFSIAETQPAVSDFISGFPTNEQANRDTIESWLLLISTNMGVLRADAMPAVFEAGHTFITSLGIEAADTNGNASLNFFDEADNLQASLIWDESDDNLSLVMWQDDGVTARSYLTLAGDTAFGATINGSNVILANSALATAITGTGALNAGSITSGFGSIDIGADAITAGAASFTTGAFSGAVTMSSTLGVTGVLTATGGIELQNTDTTLTRFAAGILGVEGVAVYPSLPVTDKSTAYTAVLADANTGIRHPAADNNARTFTIPANASVAYPVGTLLTFLNEINTVTIAINSDTLVLVESGATGSRSLAANGMATAWKVASTRWYISGVGLS